MDVDSLEQFDFFFKHEVKRFKTVTLLLNVLTHSSLHYVKPLLKEYIYPPRKGPTIPFKITQNEARDLFYFQLSLVSFQKVAITISNS